MKKSILSGIIATVVGGLMLMAIKGGFINDDNEMHISSNVIHNSALLNVSGSNNELYISENEGGVTLDDTKILGSNVIREISLPKGQRLKVKILGSNNNIKN